MEAAKDEPLGPGPPADESPEDRQARRWLEEVYQGDKMPQLTMRSVVTGMLIGGIMSISNLYVGLKTGWGLGVTITACIIAYAVFKALEAIIPAYRDRPFTVLENYTMSSAASAAGYMSSAGLVAAVPALYLATDRVLLWWEMMAWLAAVSMLGVFMAIPLKRQLINIDQLPFPSGIATAETLRSMHTSGGQAMQKARVLLWTAVAGAAITLWRDVWPSVVALARPGLRKYMAVLVLPKEIPFFPGSLGRGLLKHFTFGFEGSLIMVAAGAIMGLRVGVSLLIGAFIFYGTVAPIMYLNGVITSTGYTNVVRWTLWPATAMMVTSSLLAFGLRWRTVLRAFSGLAALLGGTGGRKDPLAHVEVPGSWFVLGTLVSGLACVLLGHYLFGIAWWMGVLAVLLTFVLSIVAARATGETDVTPIGAMGKITQLAYGVIAPTNMTTNLMTASITAGAASHSADLLTDLKSGYLLGGNSRKQTISQLFGVLAGTLFCVPVYAIIVRTPPKPVQEPVAQVSRPPAKPTAKPARKPIAKPADAAAENGEAADDAEEEVPPADANSTNLGTKDLPAPSAVVWAAVAKMLAKGLVALPRGATWAMVIGGLLGILITLGEEFLPRRYARWIPSAVGLGVAGVVPAFNSISMFLGAFGAWVWMRTRPEAAEKYTIAGSSGLIAGESLMGVGINLCREGPAMLGAILRWWKG